MSNENVIGALEGFLNDVWLGESKFEEVLNIMGYNELKYILDLLKDLNSNRDSLVDKIYDLTEENENLYGKLNEIESIIIKFRNEV